MGPELEEYTLALRAREGDQEALAELVERSRTALFAVAYGELRHYEDAQDAVAAALLRVCRLVMREDEGLAWQVLTSLGVDLEGARHAVADPALRSLRDEVVSTYRRRDDGQN